MSVCTALVWVLIPKDRALIYFDSAACKIALAAVAIRAVLAIDICLLVALCSSFRSGVALQVFAGTTVVLSCIRLSRGARAGRRIEDFLLNIAVGRTWVGRGFCLDSEEPIVIMRLMAIAMGVVVVVEGAQAPP